jgi:CubicO group peptidase (beta-lactamase class C family)
MKVKFAGTFFLLLLILSVGLKAQQTGISIHGKIIGSDDHFSIPGANISIDRKGVGTATNSSGEYILIIPTANANDTLRASCIGYKTKLFAVNQLKNGQVLNITLEKNSVQLREVSVGYHDPLKIIQTAIDRIPKNYINHPHVTRGFYRMYTSKGKDPLELSEAVFDIYNFGYADKREDLFKLIKARDEKNERDFHALELGQKPNSVFEADVVNHLAATGFLSDAGLTKHKYEVMGIVDVKGYEAYEIDFKEKPDTKEDITYRGKMYVDTKSYAFIYFDYSLSPQGLINAEIGSFAARSQMKSDGIDISYKRNRSKVSYQKVADKWVLSDVVGDNDLYINSPGLKYDFVANVKFNYQVTSVDTTQVASFNTKLDKNAHINDHDSDAGEEYWKDYNILLADFSTEDVFKQIKAINSAVSLKIKFEDKERKLPKDTLARLEALLNFYHDNGQFNGTALIKNKGTLALSKSYGYADKEAKTTGDSHTVYNLGPASQAFTAVIINQMVAEKKLDLKAPVKNYIPYYAHGDITIAQLLTHQSGIPDYLNNADYKVRIMSKPFTLKDMVLNFCSDTLNVVKDTLAEYSSANFEILALVAQEVSGKPFETLLQDRIFTPLQMNDTYFGTGKPTDGKQAKGYVSNTAAQGYDAANLAGAGGISSSADDLLKFHEGLLTNKLMPLQQKIEMLKPRVAYIEGNGWFNYGLMTDKGFFNLSAKHVVTYQTGTEVGFSAILARQEDGDTCIILLSNNGDFPKFDLAGLILDILN